MRRELAPEQVKSVLTIATAIVLAMTAAGFLMRKAEEPLRHYGHGYWAEARLLVTAERFAEEGFLASRLAPSHQFGDLDDAPMEQRYLYLRSQPMVYVAGGVLHKMGVSSLAALRRLSAALHAAGLLCFFFLARRFAPAPVALLAMGLLAFSLPVYMFADSPVMHGYVWLMTFGPLLFWHVRAESGGPRLADYLWMNGFFLIQGLFLLFEYWIFAQAFLWLGSFAWGFPRRKRLLLFLLPGHALAALLTLARNAWHHGASGAAGDIARTVLWRMVGIGDESSAEGAFSWGTWAERFFTRFPDVFAGFHMAPHAEKFFLLAAIASAVWPWRRRENFLPETASAARFGLVLFASGALYHLAFAQAAAVHYFPVGDLAPGACMLLAALIWGLWERTRESSVVLRRLGGAAAAFLACAAVALNMNACVLFERDPAFVGHFGEAAVADRFLPKDAVVGHSTFLPAIHYYVHRPFVMPIETPEGLERFREHVAGQFPDKPLFFVLAPPVRGDVTALRAHLAARYSLALDAPGARLMIYNLSSSPMGASALP